MPYIEKKDRQEIDPAIKEVIEHLNRQNWSIGTLNYVFTRVVWEFFNRRKSYSTINAIHGVLGCVWEEFWRRKGIRYENQKITQNGDIMDKW